MHNNSNVSRVDSGNNHDLEIYAYSLTLFLLATITSYLFLRFKNSISKPKKYSPTNISRVDSLIEKGVIEITDIPDEYNCSLTYHVMTKVVYFKQNPKNKYDISEIYKWLENKDTDPFTRGKVTKSDLIEDKELSSEIEKWLVGQENLKDKNKMLNI